ncbi:MAG TPA: class I SAM-dependent methyltransferase [Terriglobales bacterium]|nr:class I SAM-dependent methyltransferase [Terriglobales bacterium]
MAEHVCPWWVGYFLISPLRRWFQDPAAIVGPYVKPGMTVLEPGPGMGFFTVELARQVGAEGKVVAVDIGPRMIATLKRRMAKAGLLNRTDARVSQAGSMGLGDLRGRIDFTLAFYMVHEMPSASRFFQEAAECTKPGGTLLLAEPPGHVKQEIFEAELQQAAKAGFAIIERPKIRGSLAALLMKPA